MAYLESFSRFRTEKHRVSYIKRDICAISKLFDFHNNVQ